METPPLREFVSRSEGYNIEYVPLENFIDVGGAGDEDAKYKSVILWESPATSQLVDKRSMSMFLHDATNEAAPIDSTFMDCTSVFIINSGIHVICRPLLGLFDRTFVAHYDQTIHSLGLQAVLDPSKAFFNGSGVFPDESFLVGLSLAFNQRHAISGSQKSGRESSIASTTVSTGRDPLTEFA